MVQLLGHFVIWRSCSKTYNFECLYIICTVCNVLSNGTNLSFIGLIVFEILEYPVLRETETNPFTVSLVRSRACLRPQSLIMTQGINMPSKTSSRSVNHNIRILRSLLFARQYS